MTSSRHAPRAPASPCWIRTHSSGAPKSFRLEGSMCGCTNPRLGVEGVHHNGDLLSKFGTVSSCHLYKPTERSAHLLSSNDHSLPTASEINSTRTGPYSCVGWQRCSFLATFIASGLVENRENGVVTNTDQVGFLRTAGSGGIPPCQ